jgi:hypothetical protein
MGLEIAVANGYDIITTGKPLSELPLKVYCNVCKRVIKYDVVKGDKDDRNSED